MLFPSDNFASGFVCALLLITWLGLVRWARAKIAPFWKPDNPHLQPKPPPFTVLTGCFTGYFFLIVFVVVGVSLVVWLFRHWM